MKEKKKPTVNFAKITSYAKEKQFLNLKWPCRVIVFVHYLLPGDSVPGSGAHFTLNIVLAVIWGFLLEKLFFLAPQKSFPVILRGSFQSRMNGSFCNTAKLPLSVSIVRLLLESSQAGIMQDKWVTEIYWCQLWFCIHNIFYCYF